MCYVVLATLLAAVLIAPGHAPLRCVRGGGCVDQGVVLGGTPASSEARPADRAGVAGRAARPRQPFGCFGVWSGPSCKKMDRLND